MTTEYNKNKNICCRVFARKRAVVDCSPAGANVRACRGWAAGTRHCFRWHRTTRCSPKCHASTNATGTPHEVNHASINLRGSLKVLLLFTNKDSKRHSPTGPPIHRVPKKGYIAAPFPADSQLRPNTKEFSRHLCCPAGRHSLSTRRPTIRCAGKKLALGRHVAIRRIGAFMLRLAPFRSITLLGPQPAFPRLNP